MKKELTIMRLDRYLSELGYGTRKEVKKLVAQGIVTVDGETITDPGFRTAISATVAVDGEIREYKPFEYILLNKPSGYICSTKSGYDGESVLALLPDEYWGLSPVGRLDKDTTGLLLLTNDGDLNHHLTSPKRGVEKTYYAVATIEPSETLTEAFGRGIVLDDGYVCAPAQISPLDENQVEFAALCRDNKLETDAGFEHIVTVREGKHHQIKRMFAAMGGQVLYLKRVRFGCYDLPEDLAESDFIEVDARY